MKEIITKEIFSELTNTSPLRPIDMYLIEIINTTIIFLYKTVKMNKKINKKKMNKRSIDIIAKNLLFDSFDFIQTCINCKYKCLFEKNEDGTKLFEYNFFSNGQVTKDDLPEVLKEMTKLDFFIYELSIGVANKITDEIREDYPEDFTGFLYYKIIDHIAEFTKKTCSGCHISCLDDPLEENFYCFDCLGNKNEDCPYNNDRREYINKSMVQ